MSFQIHGTFFLRWNTKLEIVNNALFALPMQKHHNSDDPNIIKIVLT